jgi:protocatechuate 3,4-dioxygenase beta subunit
MDTRITRRASLLRAGGFVAAALGAGAWRSEALLDSSAAGGPAAVASGEVSCVLAPEQTEGPYYLEGDKVRRNITEGKPGMPLTLNLKVVDASTCNAIKGATVDIWHCDAGGVYSGGQQAVGRTFLRGIQKTNAQGIATFQTVYPGWYQGRTVHIHVKVHLAGNVVHTGQLYFPDALTDAVYKRAPYSNRPGRETRNVDDGIYHTGGRRSSLSLRKRTKGAGYVGAITMGVQRS